MIRAVFDDLPAAIETLRKSDVDFSMLFLDAKDETIVARYEAQRRPHPLQEGRVLDGIRAERSTPRGFDSPPTTRFDTTGMNVRELHARTVREMFADGPDKNSTLLSASSDSNTDHPQSNCHGVDMRFIPNPTGFPSCVLHWTGDALVRDYVLQ